MNRDEGHRIQSASVGPTTSETSDLGKITLLVVTIVVLLLVAQNSDAASPATLTFFAKSEVAASTITVDDVARLQGVKDREARDLIRQIDLGRAPAPTATKSLSRPMIESALRRAGVLDRLKVRFPKRMKVSRPGRRIAADVAEDMVFTAVDELARSLSTDDKEFVVQRGRWTKALLVPLGELTLKAATRSDAEPTGLTTFVIDVTVDGTVVDSERVSAKVTVFGPVCSVVGNIDRNGVLRRGDLEESRGQLSRGGISCADALGQAARSTIRSGSVLRASQLKAPILVERGQPVGIVYQHGGLKVRAKGRAERAGARGDWIPVLNVSSRKTLRARVVSASTVQVN